MADFVMARYSNCPDSGVRNGFTTTNTFGNSSRVVNALVFQWSALVG